MSVYFILLRGKKESGQTVMFANYRVGLPEGWESETVQESVIDVYPDGSELCLIEPTVDATKKPCHYVYVHPKGKSDFKVVISDTDKIPLGGGGFISSVTEKIDLGREDNKGTFNFTLLGMYENPENPNDEGTKTLDENGNPVLYYVWGCLKDDLCISHTSQKHSDNWNDAEAFKTFVNALKIR